MSVLSGGLPPRSFPCAGLIFFSRTIPKFTAFLNQSDLGPTSPKLIEEMHRYGVNCRHLGLVLAGTSHPPPPRGPFWTERTSASCRSRSHLRETNSFGFSHDQDRMETGDIY